MGIVHTFMFTGESMEVTLHQPVEDDGYECSMREPPRIPSSIELTSTMWRRISDCSRDIAQRDEVRDSFVREECILRG